MQFGERPADLAAMGDGRAAHPHAFEEGDQRGRPAGERAEQLAVVALDRQRAGDALAGEMVHQAEEERQVVRVDALFVEGQDERALGGVQQEIRVLGTFGNALVGEQPSRRIFPQEGFELAFGNVRIDRHASRSAVDEGHVGLGEFDIAQARA